MINKTRKKLAFEQTNKQTNKQTHRQTNKRTNKTHNLIHLPTLSKLFPLISKNDQVRQTSFPSLLSTLEALRLA